MAQKRGTVSLSADISLAEGKKAPTEIRLLAKGVNRTDRAYPMSEVTFDELAAASVLGASRKPDGTPIRLYADWNHGHLDPKADRVRGASSASFVLDVREGDLYASDIRWTDLGRADVESEAWNLYSPAFHWELGDDGACRPKYLVNFALVNQAGLKDIEPLLAARAAHLEEETATMDEIKELKEKLDAANARVRALEGTTGEVIALSAAVGLAGDAASNIRLSAVQGLVALRGEVFKVTGESTPESAVAALRALKVNAEKAIALEAQLEAGKVVALRAELDAAWAVGDKKVSPADRAEMEASFLALSGGKVTPEVVNAAKLYVAKAIPTVKMVGQGERQPGSGSSPELAQTRMDQAMGIDPIKFAEYRDKQIAAGK